MGTIPATARTEELPSGRKVTYVQPRIPHLLVAGYFPEPIDSIAQQAVSGLAGDKDDGVMPLEEIKQWEEFRARVVSWMIRAINGTEVEISWKEIDDPEQWAADDVQMLFGRALVGGGPKVGAI
jgi:hypothetical protein